MSRHQDYEDREAREAEYLDRQDRLARQTGGLTAEDCEAIVACQSQLTETETHSTFSTRRRNRASNC